MIYAITLSAYDEMNKADFLKCLTGLANASVELGIDSWLIDSNKYHYDIIDELRKSVSRKGMIHVLALQRDWVGYGLSENQCNVLNSNISYKASCNLVDDLMGPNMHKVVLLDPGRAYPSRESLRWRFMF